MAAGFVANEPEVSSFFPSTSRKDLAQRREDAKTAGIAFPGHRATRAARPSATAPRRAKAVGTSRCDVLRPVQGRNDLGWLGPKGIAPLHAAPVGAAHRPYHT